MYCTKLQNSLFCRSSFSKFFFLLCSSTWVSTRKKISPAKQLPIVYRKVFRSTSRRRTNDTGKVLFKSDCLQFWLLKTFIEGLSVTIPAGEIEEAFKERFSPIKVTQLKNRVKKLFLFGSSYFPEMKPT
ncbi:hypothetical protein CDAR_272491 [Caerostris darwini]|uniref:LAGLIDADG homing endonuclease n=1 Tax=Caerostris darwini TaxID=1538125 RepID=A0AAV4UZA6_9ARAC|nr:hypothetical protein CDAR_272491 [Caerostris darwini]